jgi:hypothetical protein
MSKDDKSRLVLLERFYDSYKAQVIRSLLESAGIECFLFDTEAHNVTGQLQPGLGGIRLMVPEHLYEKALEVISETKE